MAIQKDEFDPIFVVAMSSNFLNIEAAKRSLAEKLKVRPLPIPFPAVLMASVVLCAVLFFESYVSFTAWKSSEHQFPLIYKLMIPISNYMTWALLVSLVYANLHAFPLKRPLSLHAIGKHTGAAIGIIALQVVLSYVILSIALYLANKAPFDGSCGWEAFTPGWIPQFFDFLWKDIQGNLILRFIEYWIIIGILMAIDFNKRLHTHKVQLANMEKELSKAQLNALKMQLQPHFLFNALNAVSSLMDKNTKEAQTVLARFGGLLRTMLKQNHDQFSTLRAEWAYIQNYLEIEQIRFQDRLHIQYEIAEDTLNARVPVLILQPLAENAIKHGFAGLLKDCTIKIVSKRVKNRLMLSVEDNGKGCDKPHAAILHSGVGIRNTLSRLKQLYKDQFDIKVHSERLNGFKFSIYFPFECITYQEKNVHSHVNSR